MQHEIEFGPAYAMATIHMEPEEPVTVEAGSMIAMSDGLSIKTTLGGNKKGFFSGVGNFFLALMRKMFGGESFFVNTYCLAQSKKKKSEKDKSEKNQAEKEQSSTVQLMIAPALSGDIVHHELTDKKGLILQSGAFLACTKGILVRTRFGGIRSFFSQKGFFWLYAKGSGDLFLNSYGAIHEVNVNGTYIADTGHIVAFEESLDYKIKSSGGVKATIFSGEGLVCEFKGKGKLLVQSRSVDSLVDWIIPRLPS